MTIKDRIRKRYLQKIKNIISILIILSILLGLIYISGKQQIEENKILNIVKNDKVKEIRR